MSNELKSHPGIVSLPSRVVAVVGLVLLVSLAISLPAFAQDNPASVRRIRAIETDDLGVVNPAGLAYSPATSTFHVVEVRQPARLPAPFSDIIDIRPVGDRVGQVRMWATTADPINMTYDPEANRMLLYGSASGQLLEMAAGADGRLDAAMLARHDGRRFALQNPQGMAVDPASGNLFFLDSSGPRIVRIEPSPDGGYEDAVMTEADLAQLNSPDLHGLAMNPANGHLYVLGRAEQTLYELTQAGRVVASRDVSGFRLSDPQGMVFAPSGDLTDDPSSLSLYIADSGLGAGQERRTASPAAGQIIELPFAQPAAPAAAGFVASLVHTTDTSLWLPPSPDPVGIAYIDSSNTLMVSDSEVDEMGIFTGENLFRMSLSGDLVDTLTTVSFSIEPAGIDYNPSNGHLFFSDDDLNEIFEMDPGADGLYDTGDDIITSFDTEVFGSTDPTDVAFARGMGHLFISDWVNSEVFHITPGDNGVFDGVDDLVTSFDTIGLGVLHPESVAFNPDNGHLYIVGVPVTATVETTVGGDFVQTIDISAADPFAPSGLTFAPSSMDPNVTHIYITEWGIDNSVDFNENDGKVYEMNLVYGVKVEPPSDAGSGDPGADVVYSLRVTNSGIYADTFNLAVSGASWPTAAPGAVGPLAPGAWADVGVTVTVPLDAGCSGVDSATITLTSQSDGIASDSSDLTTSANAVYGVTVTPPSDAASGDSGADVVYALWVANTGNCADTFDLTLTGDAWTTETPSSVGPLAAGVGTSVDVTVTVPLDAGCGDEDSATVTLTSQGDGTASDTSDLTTSANAVRGVVVEPTSNAAWDDPGAEVAYTLWVTNSGNCADTFDVTLTGDEWTTEAPGTVGPLAAGVGSSVDVTVTVPTCTVGGADDASAVRFSSQNDGTVWDSAALTTAARYVVPMAFDDLYLVLEDTPRVVDAPGVLGNDNDANCDTLSASLEAAPANGTVVLEADGSFTYTPTVNFSGDDGFTYSASDGALVGTATVTLTVVSAGDDPIVEAGGDQTVDEGETVQFAGSFVDPARRLLFADETIHWDFGDGNTATGSLTPKHEYWDSGLFTVTLTVTDTAGDAGEDSLLVTVRNVAPTVDAGPDQPAVPGKPLGMSGGFTDPGLDDTHSIIWDLDDGTIMLDTLSFDHTYGAVGVYTVTLTVIDDDAGVGSDTAVIDVWYRPYLPLVSRDYAP